MEHKFAIIFFIVGVVLGRFLKIIIDFLPQKFGFKEENQKEYRYFIIELTTAIVTTLLYIKLNLSLDFLIVLILFYILIILSFIDFKYLAVPDTLLLIALILPFVAPSYNILEQLKNSFLLTGAVVLLSFLLNFYVQNIKSAIFKDEKLRTQTTLGEGDIPIIAIIGAILPLQSAVVAIFLASFFAIIPALYNKIVRKELETPFIPFLSLGLFVEYIFSLSRVFS